MSKYDSLKPNTQKPNNFSKNCYLTGNLDLALHFQEKTNSTDLAQVEPG